ncbi:MAG: hypothetical protein EOP49_47815, partial [Sphingobacteriales bacterium]
MENPQEVLVLAILISSLVVVVLAVFTLMFILLFVKKKKRLHAENVRLQVTFSETLMQAQLEIQEQTMSRISTEIHDNIGQILSLVSLNLHTLNTKESDKLSNMSALVGKAIQDLRSLSKSLSSDQIREIGFIETVKKDLLILEALHRDRPCRKQRRETRVDRARREGLPHHATPLVHGPHPRRAARRGEQAYGNQGRVGHQPQIEEPMRGLCSTRRAERFQVRVVGRRARERDAHGLRGERGSSREHRPLGRVLVHV